MIAQAQERRDCGFAIGLLTGAVVGAGLMLWLAPRALETVGNLTRKGQAVRDDVADVVARSAHEVERFATAAKTANAR